MGFLEAMRQALARHMQAIARLQDAAIQNDSQMRNALEAVVREARESRESAFQDFRKHLLEHRANAATAGAMFWD
jgi:hypothetical protein